MCRRGAEELCLEVIRHSSFLAQGSATVRLPRDNVDYANLGSCIVFSLGSLKPSLGTASGVGKRGNTRGT